MENQKLNPDSSTEKKLAMAQEGPDNNNAFMGSPLLFMSSVLATFEALSAQYTRLEAQEKALSKAYSLTNNAKRQTRAAASVLAGAKP